MPTTNFNSLVGEVESFFDRLGSFFSKKKIGDLNKFNRGYSVTIYGICSENIDSSTYQQVKKAIECMYVAQVEQAVGRISAQAMNQGIDPVEAVRSRLANSPKLSTGVTQTIDRATFAESIVFNDRTVEGSKAVLHEDKGERGNFPFARIDASKTTTVIEIGRGKDKEAKMTVDFTATVKLLPVPTDKLIEVVGTTRDRSVLFNFLKMRAGASSFWKGFVANLREIEKSVDRKLSKDLGDRMIEDMVRGGGFTAPRLMNDLGEEIRQYVMVLEKSEADELKTRYGFDLRKPSALEQLFDGFLILSLVVVDANRKEMVIHSSDNPSDYDVVNYDKYKDDQMMALFQNIIRR